MSQRVSIRLTPENASNLEGLQKRQPIVLEDLINRALSNYFFAMRFDEVRARLSQPVEGQPQYTEDEIFDLVS
jgi:hypothetical protein